MILHIFESQFGTSVTASYGKRLGHLYGNGPGRSSSLSRCVVFQFRSVFLRVVAEVGSFLFLNLKQERKRGKRTTFKHRWVRIYAQRAVIYFSVVEEDPIGFDQVSEEIEGGLCKMFPSQSQPRWKIIV